MHILSLHLTPSTCFVSQTSIGGYCAISNDIATDDNKWNIAARSTIPYTTPEAFKR